MVTDYGVKMNPLSNKIVVPLLVGAVALFVYWFTALFSEIDGRPFSHVSLSLFELYLSLGIDILVILGLKDAYKIKTKWDMNNVKH